VGAVLERKEKQQETGDWQLATGNRQWAAGALRCGSRGA
jgi:hypothetical protein